MIVWIVLVCMYCIIMTYSAANVIRLTKGSLECLFVCVRGGVGRWYKQLFFFFVDSD
jgi:hypothetical protein